MDYIIRSVMDATKKLSPKYLSISWESLKSMQYTGFTLDEGVRWLKGGGNVRRSGKQQNI